MQPAGGNDLSGGPPDNRWTYSGNTERFTRTWARGYVGMHRMPDGTQVPVWWRCVRINVTETHVEEVWTWEYLPLPQSGQQ